MKKKEFFKKSAVFLLTAVMAGNLLAVVPNNVNKIQAANKVTSTENSVKTMNFGTKGLVNPTVPTSATDKWQGSYLYFGTFEGTPIKYRVLDVDSTDFGGTSMLLDCDTVLWNGKNSAGQSCYFDDRYNTWAESDMKRYLNSEKSEGLYDYSANGFLTTSFSEMEQNIIMSSVKNSASSTNGTGLSELMHCSLTGEKIFFLDNKEATDTSYGYHGATVNDVECRMKSGANSYWWLRSATNKNDSYVGFVHPQGGIYTTSCYESPVGVSPAMNLNPESIFFISTTGMNKTGSLMNTDAQVASAVGLEWKTTLNDSGKTVNVTDDKKIIKSTDGHITVPFSYTDVSTVESEKVNQISVMITDKIYSADDSNILYYGALQNIMDSSSSASDVSNLSSGIGSFELPEGFEQMELGVDYHIYILAEHANVDNLTDYASDPVELTDIYDEISDVSLEVSAPVGMAELDTEINVNATGVTDLVANAIWTKSGDLVSGNAGYNCVYTVSTTLTADRGYVFTTSTVATINGVAANVVINNDETITVSYTFLATEYGTIDYNEVGYDGVYDGNSHGITINVTNPSDTRITYSTDGEVYSETNPLFADKGTYTISYKIEKEDYTTITGSSDVVIGAATISITADDQVITVGENIDNSKFTATGLVSGDAILCATLTASTEEETDNGIISVSNAKIVNASGKDVTNNYDIIYNTGNLVINAKKVYQIKEGEDSCWVLNDESNITIVVDGDFDKFVGVKINGEYIDEAYYTAKPGSIIITLKSSYLNTLSEGTHTFELICTDGAATTTFAVTKSQEAESDVTDEEETESDVTDEEETESDVTDEEETESDVMNEEETESDVTDEEESESDVTDEEETEEEIVVPGTRDDSMIEFYVLFLMISGIIVVGFKKAKKMS